MYYFTLFCWVLICTNYTQLQLSQCINVRRQTHVDDARLEEHTHTHWDDNTPAVIIRMSMMVIGWAQAYLPISFILRSPIYLAGLCRHTYLPIQGTDARYLFSFAVLLSLVSSFFPSCMHPRFIFFPYLLYFLCFVFSVIPLLFGPSVL